MNKKRKRIEFMQSKGFTVVELLIVIAVIVILATITIVTYNSVQDRAYDSAVQSDLDNATGLMESYRISSSAVHEFPRTTANLESLKLTATKNSYDTTAAVNYVYCINNTDYKSFAIAALSKSGNVFLVTQDGLQTTTIVKADFTSGANICGTKLSLTLVSAGMSSPGTWQTWVRT